MAGCYGNSKEDRYFEAMLNRYLDAEDPWGETEDEEEPDPPEEDLYFEEYYQQYMDYCIMYNTTRED